LAVNSQDHAAVKAVIDRHSKLPRSSTLKHIVERGIFVGDQLLKTSDSVLFRARKGSVLLVLKKLGDFEVEGYRQVYKLGCKNSEMHYLVPSDMFQAESPEGSPSSKESSVQPTTKAASILEPNIIPQGSTIFRTPAKLREGASTAHNSSHKVLRDWVSMPLYGGTLDDFPKPLENDVVSKMIRQLMIGLQFLHDNGLVHMDVKPSNIFVDQRGDFFLGDFGSVTKIDGKITSTTKTFFPEGVDIGQAATTRHDYWMLAMTVKDVISQCEIGEVGIAAKFPALNEVIEAIKNIETEESLQLLGFIDSSL
jgi:hypothetical protein